MISRVLLLIIFFKIVFSSELFKLSDYLIINEIPEYFEFNDFVSLSQTNKYLRSLFFDRIIYELRKNYPDFPNWIQENRFMFCSYFLRPCKYFEDDHRKYCRVPIRNYGNAEQVILALISSPHAILENTQIAVFSVKTFININHENRTLSNDFLINERFVNHLLPLHFFNKPVIREFLHLHKCTRSKLLLELYCKGYFELHTAYFFENILVTFNYSIQLFYTFFITALFLQFVEKEKINKLVFIGIFYISTRISELIYDNFLLI